MTIASPIPVKLSSTGALTVRDGTLPYFAAHSKSHPLVFARAQLSFPQPVEGKKEFFSGLQGQRTWREVLAKG